MNKNQTTPIPALIHEALEAAVAPIREGDLKTRPLYYFSNLPGSIFCQDALDRVRFENDGYILFKGFPVPSGEPDDRTAEAILMMVASFLGFPIWFNTNPGDGPFQTIEPIEGKFPPHDGWPAVHWHTNNAYHPDRADFLLFFCTRGDPGCITYISEPDLRKESGFPPVMVEALRKNDFFIRPEPYHDLGDNGTQGNIVGVRRSGTYLVYASELIEPTSAAGKAAYNLLGSTIGNTFTPINLEPGDLLVVDNNSAVISESSYFPQFNGQDRLIRRLEVVEKEPLFDVAVSPNFMTIEGDLHKAQIQDHTS